MSELAFNTNGDFFEVPAVVTGWRVRRLKPSRGAPELVYARDGRPLTIPIESGIDELRDAVGGVVGRYRLDPVDEDGKILDTVPAAYIQVVKPELAAVPATALVHNEGDSLVREAMRLNTELAKSVVDRFPEMMHAAAELLRAADGAGLPAREPRATDEDEDEDEGDDEDELEPKPGFDLVGVLEQVLPDLISGFMTGDMKVPKLAALLDWRKATSAANKNEPAAPTAEAATEAAAASAAPPIELPPIDPAMMMHFIAIQSALTPAEAVFAREVAKDLGPAELRVWFDELKELSVPDAVQKIRAQIGGGS